VSKGGRAMFERAMFERAMFERAMFERAMFERVGVVLPWLRQHRCFHFREMELRKSGSED
jgi:hypothetical protein